jgi:hypothetical protein
VENCWFEMELYCHSVWRIVGLKWNVIFAVCREMLVSSRTLLSHFVYNCWLAVGLYFRSLFSLRIIIRVIESNEEVGGACSSQQRSAYNILCVKHEVTPRA